MGRRYCHQCGKKLNWITEHSCSECYEILCYACKVMIKKREEKDYCINCAITELQKKKERFEKHMICGKCGNKAPKANCIYCPLCGNKIKEKEIPKVVKNK